MTVQHWTGGAQCSAFGGGRDAGCGGGALQSCKCSSAASWGRSGLARTRSPSQSSRAHGYEARDTTAGTNPWWGRHCAGTSVTDRGARLYDMKDADPCWSILAASTDACRHGRLRRNSLADLIGLSQARVTAYDGTIHREIDGGGPEAFILILTEAQCGWGACVLHVSMVFAVWAIDVSSPIQRVHWAPITCEESGGKKMRPRPLC